MPAYRRIRMPRKCLQVLVTDLNRSEPAGAAGSSPVSIGPAHGARPDHHAGIQFASQSVSSTKVTTNIAPTIMSCPRRKFGRSAALILIIAPPEHIEM